jgi:hypothetical protein
MAEPQPAVAMVPPVIIERQPPAAAAAPADPAERTQLLRSLRRLVRGLSALFWGLPLTLLVAGQSLAGDLLRPLGVIPPLLVTGLLLHGVLELRHFRPQERPWREALERAQFFGWFNLGLAPFLFFWSRFPHEDFFLHMVLLLGATWLVFLVCLNVLLQRLAAMLPDETLRTETRLFTAMNLNLVAFVFLAIGVYLASVEILDLGYLPVPLAVLLVHVEETRSTLSLFLVLLPLAMTMTLLWKTKEVVLESVFGAEH